MQVQDTVRDGEYVRTWAGMANGYALMRSQTAGLGAFYWVTDGEPCDCTRSYCSRGPRVVGGTFGTLLEARRYAHGLEALRS